MWRSAFSRVVLLQLFLFLLLFCSSSQQNFSQELCITTVSTPSHTVLCSTQFYRVSLSLSVFKILLFLSQKPPLCQIQLLLFCLQKHRFQLFLRFCDCTFSPTSSLLGWVSTCKCWRASGLHLWFLSPSLSFWFVPIHLISLMKIRK